MSRYREAIYAIIALVGVGHIIHTGTVNSLGLIGLAATVALFATVAGVLRPVPDAAEETEAV